MRQVLAPRRMIFVPERKNAKHKNIKDVHQNILKQV